MPEIGCLTILILHQDLLDVHRAYTQRNSFVYFCICQGKVAVLLNQVKVRHTAQWARWPLLFALYTQLRCLLKSGLSGATTLPIFFVNQPFAVNQFTPLPPKNRSDNPDDHSLLEHCIAFACLFFAALP